jgi:hypothetical protein
MGRLWIAAAVAAGCAQGSTNGEPIAELRSDVADLRAELRETRDELRAVRTELRAHVPSSPASPSEPAPTADAGTPKAMVQAKPEPPPRQGIVKIAVESNPSGAKVYIGDKVVGRTPVLLEREPGSDEISLRLELDGYRARLLSVRPEEDTKLSVQLAKK